jgi:hypothetical protein
VPDNAGIGHRGWTHAIGAYDIRDSGHTDLWFATDFSKDKLYFNNGSGNFEPSFDSVKPAGLSTNGMSAEIADVDNDGHPLVFVSQLFVTGEEVTGNLLWKWKKGGEFAQIAEERGVDNCGWSWGAKFLDFENDGKLDLFVGNGYISANPLKSYWYFVGSLDGADRKVLADARNWPPMNDHSWSGYQRACVYLNHGGRFVNIAKATPLAQDLSDERGVAVIDHLNNGSQGLMISYHKNRARLYSFEQLNSNQWIGFKLEGTRSNRDAIGAKMILVLDDRTMTRQVQPFNGYATQNDERVHFGLGAGARIRKAWIRWPSGVRQELEPEKLKYNQYQKIVEHATN